MKTTARFFLLLNLVLAISCARRDSFNPDITQDELFAHVDFLASDSLMGRMPGTPFDRVAAKYIKDFFEANGFELLAKNGYQFFEFIDHQDIGPNNSMSINSKYQHLGKDYALFSFSSTDTIAAPVVFVGYGFSFETDSLHWDDYASVSVNEKWVMILRGDPDIKSTDSPYAGYASDRYKAMVAKDKGAAGVILVSGKEFDEKDELVSARLKTFDIGVPVVHVKRPLANKILKNTNKTITTLETRLNSHKNPSSFVVGSNVCARTHIITKKKNTQNVVAMIRGADPLLKNQYVILGAHYDHIGMGGKNSSSRMPDTTAVHNGADDNASGVAAILEIAQKLKYNPPKRSVIIAAFGAEEMGLLGSRFFIENSPVPIDSVALMINIDMLGRLNEEMTLQVGGVKTSLEKEEVLVRLNEGYDFNLALAPQGYGPSDHASFYSKNIPVLFFSTGPHIDYHSPNDVIGRINFEGLQLCSDYIFDVVKELADYTEMLTFQEAGPAAPASRHGRELKVRLGIMPDVSGVRNDGLLVLAVNEDQPAYVAGIKKGDLITAIEGKPVNNIQDYMFRLQDLVVGSTVSLELIRDGEVKVLLVQL